MLELSLITIVLIIVISFIFFKITKIIWKTILFTLLVLLIILGITSYLVYKDVNEVINGKNGIILFNEEGVQTGAIIYKGADLNIDYFTKEDLEIYESYLYEKDYESALGDKTLIIILNSSMFHNLDNTILIDEQEFSTQDGLNLIFSESTEDFLDSAKERVGINESILSEDEMIKYKLQISLLLIEELIREEGTKTLMENTEFYPERLTIKLIKQVPSLINKLIPKEDEIN